MMIWRETSGHRLAQSEAVGLQNNSKGVAAILDHGRRELLSVEPHPLRALHICHAIVDEKRPPWIETTAQGFEERPMSIRPDFIAHWSELEPSEPTRYAGDDEPLGFDASLGRLLGLTRIGIHHVRLPPGRRTSYPHAESAEEEFVFVIEGRPDAWIDGHLHALRPGDSVAFPSGTGICHTFLNNTPEEVRLLVVGEKRKPENRGRYPLNPDLERTNPYAWLDAPVRPLGSHDGHARLEE